MARLQGISPQLSSFLDLIAESEATSSIPNSDDGYLALVGSTTFTSYDDHPRIEVYIPRLHIHSSAAGRYQITMSTWDYIQSHRHLPDFSPVSQDHAAIFLLPGTLISKVESGDIEHAIYGASGIWASFPTSSSDSSGHYYQGAHPIQGLLILYRHLLHVNTEILV